MKNLKVDFENTGITEKEILEYKKKVELIHKNMHKRTEDETDFVGWIDLPTNYDKQEFARIKKTAKKIKTESDIFI